MVNINQIPLMYQAQVKGRGQIQYAGEADKAQRWAEEWLDGATGEVPSFGANVRTKEYKISWRFVCNSGQDENFTRPVIASGGFPFYPGASMKGAFLRHCTKEEALKYCGGQSANNETTPGILRFHGGYPKDNSWIDTELVDVVHPQEDWQVKNSKKPAAFVQVSLYQPRLKFGISSQIELDETEWDNIWQIWEKALEKGIGSRVSAGYGQTTKTPQSRVLPISLRGQGLASKLLNEAAEFRPNMFKAALRGHTLRLFSGVTSEKIAEELTKELWGGFSGADGAIAGLLGIAFNAINCEIYEHEYRRGGMSVYQLDNGVLNIIPMKKLRENDQKNLKNLIIPIVKFSLLLGGFGKSWRRVDHRECFPSYTDNTMNPMIGCHWEFIEKSQALYISVSKLKDITDFLNYLYQKKIKGWVEFKGKQISNQPVKWREAWHPNNVQVWARFAEDIEDSEAVKWFHGPYQGSKSIKQKTLTGGMGKISRVWHRMYPCYIKKEGKNVKNQEYQFVELLTIFPDSSSETREFLNFLKTSNIFTKVWGS